MVMMQILDHPVTVLLFVIIRDDQDAGVRVKSQYSLRHKIISC